MISAENFVLGSELTSLMERLPDSCLRFISDVIHVSGHNWSGLLLCIGILAISIFGFYSEDLFNFCALRFDHAFFRRQVWRYVSYSFMHVNYLHLVVNIISLHSISRLIADAKGPAFMLAVFFLGSIFPAVAGMVFPKLLKGLKSCVGASAGLAALFGAAAVVDPKIRFLLGFVLPMPITYGVALIVFGSIYCHVVGKWPRIWHLGHALGGAAGYAAGFLIG